MVCQTLFTALMENTDNAAPISNSTLMMVLGSSTSSTSTYVMLNCFSTLAFAAACTLRCLDPATYYTPFLIDLTAILFEVTVSLVTINTINTVAMAAGSIVIAVSMAAGSIRLITGGNSKLK